MEFKRILIKNFRNFNEIDIDISNKNIIFGRNDFGKTNFLYAIRYVFDSKLRRLGFIESDYFRHYVNEPIEIRISIELSDDENSNFLRAQMREATSFSEVSSDGKQTVYIQLCGEYSKEERIGNPVLRWGGDLDEMYLIPQHGNFNALDKIFETVYIDPNVDPSNLYRKSQSILYQGTESDNHDEITGAIRNLNEQISINSRVVNIGEKLTSNYRGIRDEEIEIELKSEMEINGTFNHLVPYIKQVIKDAEIDPDDKQLNKLYPTSGDGRRKLLAYALIRYLHELENEKGSGKKIYLYLIEEVENSLHPTMQQAISRHLFNDEMYEYIFTTTHSVDMLTYMDGVELVRIFKSNNSIQSHSFFYSVPKDYSTSRKKFNRLLSHALFSDKVLLVEGPSEEILFEAILEKLAEYEEIKYTDLEKITILDVGGIGFREYKEILDELKIITIIKTDNDLQSAKGDNKYHTTGINRCLNLLSTDKIESLDTRYQRRNVANDAFQLEPIIGSGQKKEVLMRKAFNDHSRAIREFRKSNLFLSEIELEDDLIKALKSVRGCRINRKFEEKFGKTPTNLIEFLKKSKKYNMNDFVNSESFDQDAVKAIYQHDLFQCLQVLIKGDSE
ncbi:AAA family ATPase [Sporosarcina sp. E16_8]|uniref:ATP-dependent nuclease n=1 Tax=Sporosarcina sp. E16_8 TaxID=2789295 RepID=UPI001A91EE9B|nr:AAA family ATPase [Sporosarcina sp. E16_8]MBO0587451.1 AAA family ATPase [Sporosarcina sp. E16_8]